MDRSKFEPDPKEEQPLSISWRSWLAQFPDWTPQVGAPDTEFDAIVVGSGYGGSVAALRLAERGYSVLVLERGSEFIPGEFPSDFSLVPKFMRFNIPGRGTPLGRASGLVEMHLGQGMVGVTANGLGGGSLINAGVTIEPDADVFGQEVWPAAIRMKHADPSGHEGLEKYFELARGELHCKPWLPDTANGEPLLKTQALKRLVKFTGGKFAIADLTIDPSKCVRCGDCAAGCNEPGAKQTLAATYLKKAIATGRVQIVTQAEVYRFEPARLTDPYGESKQWWVHVFSTEVQHEVLATRELLRDVTPSSTVRKVAAPMLFICAGTFGSTQLLQRSQALGEGRLSFSPTLGSHLSGNGDAISCVVKEPQAVNAVGLGAETSNAGDRRHMVGPTITAMIDLRNPEDRLEKRLLIEEGAIPRALAQLFREVLSTSWTLKQLGDWWFEPLAEGRAGSKLDPLAADDALAQRTQVLLTMGHDGSPARMVWLENLDRSAPYLPNPEQLATYVHQQCIYDRMDGRHVHNPLWRLIPESSMTLMSGKKPPRTVTTVHPLGGCVMSDQPDQGVVDHRARVWMYDPGGCRPADGAGNPPYGQGFANEPRVYQGLFILDGSIVPSSLGCNPLLTITALAERAMSFIPPATRAGTIDQQRAAPRRAKAPLSQDVPVPATLNEELLCTDVWVSGALADALGGRAAVGRVNADFESLDMLGDMAATRHSLKPKLTLLLGRKPPEPSDPAQESPAVGLRYASAGAASDVFELLPANPTSGGPALAAFGLVQLLIALAALFAPLIPLLPAARWLAQWPMLLAWLVGVPVLWIALPFTRTLLTWLFVRGWRDWQDRDPDIPFRWRAYVVPLLKQLIHASEKRVMVYRIVLHKQSPEAGDDRDVDVNAAPQVITLHARKHVVYRATVLELLQWAWRRIAVRDVVVRGRPLRPSYWEQIMDAQVRLVAGRRGAWWTVGRGKFRMGFDNLVGGGATPGRPDALPHLQLGLLGDATLGMLSLASFPLLFLRFALKTRLLDFRLPQYSRLPIADDAPDEELKLRVRGGAILPSSHWIEVPRGPSSSDRGDEPSLQPVRLRLWRYARRDAEGRPCAPKFEAGEWLGNRVVRAKSVLLLHAFGQSGLCFTLKEVDRNLAEAFYDEGYEVWILETRMSTRSGYAGEPSTVDQIAANDIPVVVSTIIDQLSREPECPAGPLQICAFAQCIGSAALWMALLSGRLSHHQPASGQYEVPPELSKISHAMFSQVHPWVVGSKLTQAKTWVPTLLEALFNRATIPFAVRGAQDSLMTTVLDRLFASLPQAPGENERPPGCRHDDAAATLRRIRYVEAPLFLRKNINDDTYLAMNRLFGDANVRLFAHARRFVQHEQLVDEDGVNRYVTEDNIRRHLAFPLQLLHGADNELFDVASVQRSFAALKARQPQWFSDRWGNEEPLAVRGYGHVDVLIGDRAATDIFGSVLSFFEKASQGFQAATPDVRWVPRAPAVGPLLGWTRLDEKRQPILRFSFFVDDPHRSVPDKALPPMLLRVRKSKDAPWRRVPDTLFRAGVYEPVTHGAPTTPGAFLAPNVVVDKVIRIDLTFDSSIADATELQVVTLVPIFHLGDQPDLARSPEELIERIGDGDVQVQPHAEFVIPRASDHAAAHADISRSIARVPRHSFDTLKHDAAVSFVLGCCRHPGFALDLGRIDDSVRRIMAMHDNKPLSFAMLLGDQIYADATAGLIDPSSPLERYYERHYTAFTARDMHRLLSSIPTYLTPDDHEWTNSYPAGSPLLMEHWRDWTPGTTYYDREQRVFRTAASALSAFQRQQMPTGGSVTIPLGRQDMEAYTFDHGCVRVFVLDTRYSRKRNSPQIVTARALARLRAWLAAAKDECCLNIVASGSVVLPNLCSDADPANPGVCDTWDFAPAQRRQLVEDLVSLVPGRFLLVSGDYHVSGAVRIHHGGEVVGAAVVAPPLYAPLPYVNAPPEAVDLAEQLTITGLPLSLSVPDGGEMLRGSGYVRIDVVRSATGFEISLERKLQVWEDNASAIARTTIALPCSVYAPTPTSRMLMPARASA